MSLEGDWAILREKAITISDVNSTLQWENQFICTQEGRNYLAASFNWFGVVFCLARLHTACCVPSHQLIEHIAVMVAQRKTWSCWSWASCNGCMSIATEVPAETVLPQMKPIKLGSCVAHRPEVNSRRDERRLVIMMKVENRIFKALSLAMRSREGHLWLIQEKVPCTVEISWKNDGVKRQMREIAKQ